MGTYAGSRQVMNEAEQSEQARVGKGSFKKKSLPSPHAGEGNFTHRLEPGRYWYPSIILPPASLPCFQKTKIKGTG